MNSKIVMKKSQIAVGLVAISASLAALVTADGCGKPPTGGTTANISFGQYTASNDTPLGRMFALVDSWLESSAQAATSNIMVCIRRVRFKGSGETTSSDPTVDPDDDDLSKDNRVGTAGYLAVGPGSPFGSVHLPSGKIATRVEIDVDNHCTGHPTVSFTTAAGSFTSNSNFTLQFRANSQVDLTKDGVVTLNWGPINAALNALSNGASDSAIIGALSTQGTM